MHYSCNFKQGRRILLSKLIFCIVIFQSFRQITCAEPYEPNAKSAEVGERVEEGAHNNEKKGANTPLFSKVPYYESSTIPKKKFLNLHEKVEGPTVEAMAYQFLLRREGDLYVSAQSLFHENTRATNSSLWTTVRYRQRYRGVDVYEADVDVTIHKDEVRFVMSRLRAGVCSFSKNRQLQHEDDGSPVWKPRSSLEEIQSVVLTKYQAHSTQPSKLVVYQPPSKTTTCRLAWQVEVVTTPDTRSKRILIDDENLEQLLNLDITVDRQLHRVRKRTQTQTTSQRKKGKDPSNGEIANGMGQPLIQDVTTPGLRRMTVWFTLPLEAIIQLILNFVEDFLNLILPSQPTESPIVVPDIISSVGPSNQPSIDSSSSKSVIPSPTPTISLKPSLIFSEPPSTSASDTPSIMPSLLPSDTPSVMPSLQFSDTPSVMPSVQFSDTPSLQFSDTPSVMPSVQFSVTPSFQFSDTPSLQYSDAPSIMPSLLPSDTPSFQFSDTPTLSTEPTTEANGYVFDPDPISTSQGTYGTGNFIDNNDATNSDLDDQRVLVVLRDVTFDGSQFSLKGPYAEIVDTSNPYNGLFKQSSPNFHFSRNELGFEAVNCYYHTDNIMRYINEDLGITVKPYQYTGGARFDPHALNGKDNSQYSSGNGQMSFGQGGVDDAEDAGVIIHELGHAIHDWITVGGLTNNEGLSEGFGDYITSSYTRSLGLWATSDTEYNWVFVWDGHNEFFNGRITNYDAIYPSGLVGQVHTDGQIWSTCNMKIWDQLGREKSDKIHLIGLSATNSNADQDVTANAIYQAAVNLGLDSTELATIQSTYQSCGYTINTDVCGDGIKGDYEDCDGSDLGGALCSNVAGCSGGGTPTCTSECTLDFSNCAGSNEAFFRFELITDSYGDETTWTLEKPDDTLVLEGGPYSNNGSYMVQSCVDDQVCYTFTIRDSGFDGICCVYGTGDYDLYYGGAEILPTNGNFGSKYVHLLGSSCKV